MSRPKTARAGPEVQLSGRAFGQRVWGPGFDLQSGATGEKSFLIPESTIVCNLFQTMESLKGAALWARQDGFLIGGSLLSHPQSPVEQ